MTDNCAKMKQILGNDACTVKKTKPPKYLSCFEIDDKEIIIIHKLLPKSSRVSSFRSSKSHGGSYSEFEVTGQPLECPFEDLTIADNSVFIENDELLTEEDFHAPAGPESEARRCLGVYNLKLKPKIPVWFLTEPSGKDNIVLLGSYFKDEWCLTSLVKIKTISPSLEEILAMIKEHTDKAGQHSNQWSSKVTAFFNPQCAEAIKLQVTWKKPSFEVPVNEADTSVIIKTKVGAEDSLISPLWQQVVLLKMYSDTIRKWRKEGLNSLPPQPDSTIPSIKNNLDKQVGNLTNKVLQLFENSNVMSVLQDAAKANTKVFKTVKEIVQEVAESKHQDFLEKLWNVLIDATTYQELDSCLQTVYQQVKMQQIKPYIKDSNKTQLAYILNNAHNDFNNRWMFNSLELLVELGLEKLMNDYLYIFNQSNLADRDLMAMPNLPNFAQTLTADWESTINNWLTWFTRIHTVLDMICLTEETLGAIFECTKTVSCAALKLYLADNSPVSDVSDVIENPSQEITVVVDTSDVVSHIGKSCRWNKWLLKLSSSSASYKVTSSYLVTPRLPFPRHMLNSYLDEEVSFNKTVNPDETSKFFNKDPSLYHVATLRTNHHKNF